MVVRSEKPQFVMAEFELLKYWSPVLEGKQKGSTLVYLQLQVGVNRQESNINIGKSWLTIKDVAERCSMSYPTVLKCIDILEEYQFVTRESRAEEGRSNLYTILDLPRAHIKVPKIEPETQEEDIKEEIIFSNGTDIIASKYNEQAQYDIEIIEAKEEGNCNDLLKYFRAVYYTVYGIKTKSVDTMRDRKNFKNMIDEYGWDRSRIAIKYAITNWNDMGVTLDGYPSVTAVYGYRETIVPESINGKNKFSARGQHKHTGEYKGVVSW